MEMKVKMKVGLVPDCCPTPSVLTFFSLLDDGGRNPLAGMETRSKRRRIHSSKFHC